jgi:hypothetical protein
VRKLVLLLIVLTVAQLGCAEGAGDAPSNEDSSEDTSEESETGDSTNGVLLTFSRSGGLVGTTETITIRSDGRAEVEGDASPPRRIEVPPESLNRLEEELQSLNWERAASEPDNVDCADCFTYDIRSGGQRITTTAMGQSGEELRDLLALIEEILATSSSR